MIGKQKPISGKNMCDGFVMIFGSKYMPKVDISII